MIHSIKRKAAQEPSIEKLARAKARGQSPKPIENGKLSSTWDELGRSLRQRAGRLRNLGEGKLDDDDRAFLYRVESGVKLERPDVVRLQCLLERHAHLLNGNGKPRTKVEALQETADVFTAASEQLRNGKAVPGKPKANGAANNHPADLAAAAAMDTEIELALDLAHPHPENRQSRDTDADVVELAESIKVDDLLQGILVRHAPAHWGLPAGHVQIVIGERRWRACRLAGRGTVKAKVRFDMDDATARRLMAIENAKRKDLTPIDKARQIERLCSPTQDGSPAMTRDQAAICVGLKDGASASNLVRLLKLPKVWQDRVAAGELDQSWARAIVPICHAPKLMDQLGASWDKHAKGKQCEFCNSFRSKCWSSRSDVEELVKNVIKQFTRPVDGSARHYGYGDLNQLANRHNYYGNHPILFDAEALGIVDQLEIHEFDVGKEKVRLATHWKLYDKHQVPAIKKLVDSRKKKQAEKAGRDKPAKKKALTPAEQKKQASDQARQLADRIAAWRHKLLRRACIASIDAGLDSGLRIVLAYAASRHPYGAIAFSDALEQVRGIGPRQANYRDEYWPCVAGVVLQPASRPGGETHDEEGEVVAKLAGRILADEAKDWRRPALPHTLVESYAAAIGVKLEQAWFNLRSDEAGRDLLEEFFLLHGTEALRSLAKELGAIVPQAAVRKGMVKLLLSRLDFGQSLPLPKCIRPLPAAKPAKGKAAKRK